MAADLPPELLHMICDQLDTGSVLNFRLVCQVWAAIGVEHIIPEISVQLHPKSLARLEAVSQHPVLSRYVYFLNYERNTLPEYTYEAWEKNVFCLAHLKKWPELSSMDQASKTRAYTQFQRVFKEQQQVYRRSEDSWVLDAAIARFPQLISLSVIDRPTYEDAWKYPELSIASKTLYGGNLQPRLASEMGSTCNVVQIKSLLTRLAKLNPRLLSLTVAELGWEFFKWTGREFEMMEGAIGCLEDLELWIKLDGLRPKDLSQMTLFDHNLQRFLSTSSDLEMLRIHLRVTLWDHRLVHLPKILADCYWPKLSFLALGGFKATAE
ncbi:MAG: hypothetical protein MMC33_001822 [Icmadophila ericetorum]|nr:hypothetical protein [Icmadophila ericetorum]